MKGVGVAQTNSSSRRTRLGTPPLLSNHHVDMHGHIMIYMLLTFSSCNIVFALKDNALLSRT